MGNYVGDHAVVLGGSIGGSLAARMLADAYRKVTVVDRDELFGPTGPRRAIPQGHHIHALLARGKQILDEVFPGFTEELVSLGVPVGDFGTSLSWYFNGSMMKKTETGLVCVAAGRPLLEERIRLRVNAFDNVTYLQHTDVLGLTATPDGGRITGVRIQARAEGSEEQRLEADLVVDCTGRGTRTPRWLTELGYPQVQEERVKMDLTYTTMWFKGPLSFDPIGDDIALIPVATPAMRRGAIFARMPDSYAISLTGILGDKPPTDYAGFMAYVESLPVPEIAKAVKDVEPIGEAMTFHFPASIRRRYERQARHPERLLVMGDAASVFNPVYGQGMTVASIESLVLRRHLEQGVPQPAAFFRDLAKVVDGPWDMAAGADLGFDGVEGKRDLKWWLGNQYIPRLQAAAVKDEQLSEAFLRAAGLVDPPTALMRPRVMARVLRPAR
ncbi:FAD-dependent oxidoreductase [Kitasatospora sp. NPDC049285]|uniref:FAD-dependent oxidoreductase n=1 Tax=Kitasatospora sp. NPDC049285 TaxID=3157096 RepID=UPI0034345BDD